MRGALVVLLLAAPAYADTAPHKEGQYGGVTPGEPPAREAGARPAKARRPPPRGTLTWIGFAAKEGGAEVFFQSVAPFELTQRIEGETVIVHLGLSRLGHNTWRPIDTRFFDNPLSRIAARAVGAVRATKAHLARAAGIEARITFKNPKDAREGSVRTATEADGMYYAYLTFPEGTGAPATGAPTLQEPEAGGQPAPREAPAPP